MHANLVQGITVAAQSAITLSRCLEHASNTHMTEISLSESYIRELYRSLDNSWRMAVASDIRFPSTVVSGNISGAKNGHASLLDRIITDKLLNRAQSDPKLYLKLLEVAHFTRPASKLTTDLYVLKAFVKAIFGHRPRQESV